MDTRFKYSLINALIDMYRFDESEALEHYKKLLDNYGHNRDNH